MDTMDTMEQISLIIRMQNIHLLKYIAWNENGEDPVAYTPYDQFTRGYVTNLSPIVTLPPSAPSDERTATNISSTRSGNPHGDHFDIHVKIQDFDGDNDFWLNIDDWGSAGAYDSLTFEGNIPWLEIDYYDHNSWEGRNHWAFNFNTVFNY